MKVLENPCSIHILLHNGQNICQDTALIFEMLFVECIKTVFTINTVLCFVLLIIFNFTGIRRSVK